MAPRGYRPPLTANSQKKGKGERKEEEGWKQAREGEVTYKTHGEFGALASQFMSTSDEWERADLLRRAQELVRAEWATPRNTTACSPPCRSRCKSSRPRARRRSRLVAMSVANSANGT